MKAILIQSAMQAEIELLIRETRAVLDKSVAGYDFYKSFWNGCPVIISKTNLGMSNAAAATVIGINEYNPGVIINQGTAGAHSKKVHTGDIIIGKSAVNINSYEKPILKDGVDYKNWIHKTFTEDPEEIAPKYTCNDYLYNIFCNTKTPKKIKVHTGIIGSGDVWNKEFEFINHLNNTLGTLCEDMETASVYNIANRFKIAVIGIRVASNNEILGEEFDVTTSQNAQKFVIDTLDTIVNGCQKHYITGEYNEIK